jgi:peptide-methionine (S)-S-oxide reductase
VKPWCSLLSLAFLVAACGVGAAPESKAPVTDPSPAPASAKSERITIGGGCFWCIEAVFQRLEGVTKVVSGYAGGPSSKPTYEEVCTGETGHAEVVQITFDPARTSYDKLLQVFWAAHDPTTVLDRDAFVHEKFLRKGTPYQGNDYGTQYRSAIFFETEEQKQAALKSKELAQKDFKKPIATEIATLKKFFPAEDYHQNYYNLNKSRNSYCSAVISPKLEKLIHKGIIAEKPVSGH